LFYKRWIDETTVAHVCIHGGRLAGVQNEVWTWAYLGLLQLPDMVLEGNHLLPAPLPVAAFFQDLTERYLITYFPLQCPRILLILRLQKEDLRCKE
jgi:hypothetical protein